LLKANLAQRAGDNVAMGEAMARALEFAPGQWSVPTHSQLLAGAIDSALREGDPAAADRWHQVLQKLLPQSPVTTMIGAQIQLSGNQPAEAVASLQRLRQQVPQFMPARPLLVAALLRTGALEQALKESGELVEQAGGEVQTRARRAQALVRVAADLVEDVGGRARAMAAALLELEQPAAAHAVLDEALAQAPDDTALASALVQLELQSGRFAAALQRASALQEAHPDDRAVMALLAGAQQANRDHAAAERTLARLWNSDPTAATALALNRVRKLAGQPGSLEPLQEWLMQHADDAGVRLTLAQELQADGKTAAAVREYERVLAKTSNADVSVRAVALNNLAWLYHQLSNPRALETARLAHETSRDQPAIADTYGWLLLLNGRRAEALPLLERAAEQAPQSPQTRYHHAAALAQAGRTAAARDLLQDVLLDPADFEGRSEAQALLASL
jgi:predicted Zn-dependent protease